MDSTPLFFRTGFIAFLFLASSLLVLCLLGHDSSLLRSLTPVASPTVPHDQLSNFLPRPSIDDINAVPEEVRLERALKKAAMADKTVIVTSVNSAWASPGSVLDILLESFRTGEKTERLLAHLVVVAVDRDAYLRCQAVHSNCFALTTDGVDFSRQENFMSPGYLKLVWRKIEFLGNVLSKGFNFLFTDADIVWFRDPSPHFYANVDFQVSCDRYMGSNYSRATNTGFHLVRSNNRTIEFYKLWYSSRLTYKMRRHDQYVLNLIKDGRDVRRIGLTIKYLDTVYFGGLCQPSKDFHKVCTMHVNCCVGLDNKVKDLRRLLNDWRNFTSRPPSMITANSKSPSWSAPYHCGRRRH